MRTSATQAFESPCGPPPNVGAQGLLDNRARSSGKALRGGVSLLISCALVSSLGVGCAGRQKAKQPASLMDPDAVRYRLPLRENPVDRGEAFRCYGHCQESRTPDNYIACLSECPGFEVTPGYRCADYEVPPVTACLTARKVRIQDELDPGLVVLGVVAGVAIVATLATICTSSPQNCNDPTYAYSWY